MILGRRTTRFTIMAAGGKGSGKSSFFNNLVSRPIITEKCQCDIDVYMLNLDGLGTSQNIVFIDTPGFGSTLNDDHIQSSIIDYIREQFDAFIEEESKIRRNPKYEDTRVHCLLYFIPATGSGLKMRDILFLRRACKLVNVIPIISKADALTADEAKAIKAQVTEQLKSHEIEVFNFSNEEYSLPAELTTTLNTAMPFTLICSNNLVNNTKTRKHPAGDIDVDDVHYSSLSSLREILLGSHLEMLIETTANDLYERYRVDALETAINQK